MGTEERGKIAALVGARRWSRVLWVPTRIKEHYLPAMEKLACHRPHVQILGKDHCAGARRVAFRHRPTVRTRRDYAERLAAAFNLVPHVAISLISTHALMRRSHRTLVDSSARLCVTALKAGSKMPPTCRGTLSSGKTPPLTFSPRKLPAALPRCLNIWRAWRHTAAQTGYPAGATRIVVRI